MKTFYKLYRGDYLKTLVAGLVLVNIVEISEEDVYDIRIVGESRNRAIMFTGTKDEIKEKIWQLFDHDYLKDEHLEEMGFRYGF